MPCRGVAWQGAAIDYVEWTNSLRLEDLPKLIHFCREKGPLSEVLPQLPSTPTDRDAAALAAGRIMLQLRSR